MHRIREKHRKGNLENLGGDEALREENMREGVWEDDGEKNMPVAGKRNQTSSLLTQAHRAKEMGKIKVENILQHKEEKMRVEEEIKRKYFGFWYVYMEALSSLW